MSVAQAHIVFCSGARRRSTFLPTPMETPAIPMPVAETNRRLDRALLGLAILGMLLMSYLTYVHFKPTGSSICNFGAGFSCDLVNKSTYAEIFGVPVSVLGIAYFAFVALLATGRDILHRYHLLLFATAGSLVFSAFLSYVEVAILDSICVFCEASKLTMIAIFVIAWRWGTTDGKRVPAWGIGAAIAAGAVGTMLFRIMVGA